MINRWTSLPCHLSSFHESLFETFGKRNRRFSEVCKVGLAIYLALTAITLIAFWQREKPKFSNYSMAKNGKLIFFSTILEKLQLNEFLSTQKVGGWTQKNEHPWTYESQGMPLYPLTSTIKRNIVQFYYLLMLATGKRGKLHVIRLRFDYFAFKKFMIGQKNWLHLVYMNFSLTRKWIKFIEVSIFRLFFIEFNWWSDSFLVSHCHPFLGSSFCDNQIGSSIQKWIRTEKVWDLTRTLRCRKSSQLNSD